MSTPLGSEVLAAHVRKIIQNGQASYVINKADLHRKKCTGTKDLVLIL